ncbi:hypothetical protein EON66_05835, partial [archaeon]
LQAYDVSKRVENTFKSLRHGVLHANMDANISSVNPKQYARRFLDFARDIFITHSVTK